MMQIDYYECGKGIAFFTNLWAKDVKERIAIPSTYCRDLILWIWVSWVFEIADKFHEATTVVVTKCNERDIRTCDFPIPPAISGKLDYWNSLK